MDGAAFSPELTAKEKAEKLQSLATGPLSASLARVSASSRALPSDKDFHFFNSFSEFKNPLRDIAGKSEFLLNSVGASAHLVFGGKPLPHFPGSADPEDSADWLVGVNDEIFERVDASLDEFRDSRNKEEAAGVKAAVAMEEDGFQLVYGKKKKPGVNVKSGVGNGGGGGSVVRVASRDPKTEGPRAKVPFHIATIPRPQDEYGILVNNSNLPFEHVWLQKSEDGCRFIHPLEKLSLEDFIDRRASDIDSVRPPLIENTPFKLVEEVKELKELAKKLQDAEEFSVDLEHNHYRSFQGLTCLMQISTRTEDFVIDTLKLRVHVGPYLREVFKDPSKRKVMHGADRDIVWLQRDFGIYVCNLFDTGQASRLLALERNSLEYLLQHFCGVTANKEYQNADWRFRPLSDDMIKYARADTHYLLYIYDLMRARLLSLSQTGDDLLLEVYNRSSAICTKLYEKELLTDTSFLYIYGLNGVDFNAQQLAVVAGLCAWRDSVARAEDESTGYILPNKALLEIARQMPNTAGKLKRLVKSKHPFVERNLNVVVSIIRSSIANAAAFEDVAEQLKKEREEMVPEEGHVATSDPISMDICPQLETIQQNTGSVKPFEQFNSAQSSSALPKTSSSIHPGQNGAYSESDTCPSIKPAAVVSVQVLKKPSRAFGAMLGSSSSKRKHEHDKTASKLEQIKSSVTLPFHSFSGVPETSRTVSVVSNTASDRASMSREAVGPASDQVFSVEGDIPLQSDKNTVFLESIDPQFGESVVAEAARDSDFIPLEVDLVDQTGKLADGSITEDTMKQKGNSDGNDDLELEPSPAYENPLAELSSSLQEYCRTVIRTEERSSEGSNDIGEPLDKLQKQMKLTEDDSKTNNGDKLSSTSLESNRVDKVFSLPRMPGEGTRDSSLEPRRSQAFPASGNRSMTFTQ